MIFEIFLGVFAIFVIFLILGLAFKQWFFTLASAITLFLLTALLWSSSAVEYHSGNEVLKEFGNDGNGTITNSSETITFQFEEIEGFNKDRFALFTLLMSIAVLFLGLEQRKGGEL